MKQVQDAYIVAATRTPIGRSGRGYFRNTRPDELLVAALKSAMLQVHKEHVPVNRNVWQL